MTDQNIIVDESQTTPQQTPPTSKSKTPFIFFVGIVAFTLFCLGTVTVIYLTKSKNKVQTNTSPTLIKTPRNVPSSSAPDIPPLYSGVEWEEQNKEKVVFHDEQSNTMELDGVLMISSPLNVYPSDFINYYRDGLENTGWNQIGVAGDPETIGGFYDYKKGNRFVTFGVRTLEGDGVGRALLQYSQ